jgi:hypothetical protein
MPLTELSAIHVSEEDLSSELMFDGKQRLSSKEKKGME